MAIPPSRIQALALAGGAAIPSCAGENGPASVAYRIHNAAKAIAAVLSRPQGVQTPASISP